MKKNSVFYRILIKLNFYFKNFSILFKIFFFLFTQISLWEILEILGKKIVVLIKNYLRDDLIFK
jgi:hypothetical protein